MAKKSKNIIIKILKITFRVILVVVLLNLTPVLVFKFIDPPVTPLMFLRALDMKADGDSVIVNYKWVPIEEMSPNLYQAAVAAEDDHFMTHDGFDFKALAEAFEKNQKNEKKVVGGSTISQQTAKNVFLWPHRNYLRKGLEAWFTLLIENFWGKKRIMEVYLNVVEMGDGIYGVEAASKKYFNKPASDLSKYEAASLIAILPNPHIYKVHNPSAHTIKYRNAIAIRMGIMPKVSFE